MRRGFGVQVAVTYIPAPSFILTLQLLSSAGFVKTLAATGTVEAEPLSLAKARPFAIIVFGFIGTLYSNITSLKVHTHGLPPIDSLCVPVCIEVSGFASNMLVDTARLIYASTGSATLDNTFTSTASPHMLVYVAVVDTHMKN